MCYYKFYKNGSIRLFSIFILCHYSVTAQRVDASDFGFNSFDATECLRDALSSKFDTLVIRMQKGNWNIAPLIIKDIANKTIIFENGVIIKALPGKFKDISSSLISLVNVDNLKMIGNGATLQMNKKEYIKGEWRHALNIRQCKNIFVKDFLIRDSGGDGIYIAGKGEGTYSEDIYIEDVKSINNKRQGMSIISAQNVFVKNCEFTQTGGTLPEAGLDIEPNNSKDRIININFENCSFTNNNHSGILLSLGKLDVNSLSVSISFKNCYLSNNHVESNKYAAAEINISANNESPVKGKVIFDNCFVENSNWGMLFSRKRSDAFHVTFIDCAAKDICKNENYTPIGFEVPDYRTIHSSLGGFTFTGLFLEYSSSSPIIKVRGSRLGTLKSLKDINAQITVKNDHLNASKLLHYINYDPEHNEEVNIIIQLK